MRTEGLERLTYPRTNKKDHNYLVYTPLFAELERAIAKYAKGDVLDIGCGNKPYLPFFEGKVNSYVGCDVVQSDKNLVDIISPATEIPLPDNSKDTVFSTQVIEHVAEHQKLLNESFRILRPGGFVIVSGPMAWEHHEIPYDFFRFTRYGFEHIFTKAGFTDIEIIPNGGKWSMIGQLFQNSYRSSVYGKRSLGRRFFKGIYVVFRLKWIINSVFGWLDKVDRDDEATLNFVVVARKPKA